MSPLILIGVLLLAAGLAYLPIPEQRARWLGTVMTLTVSVMGLYLAWQGFKHIQVFGPSSLWYLDSLTALIITLIAVISLTTAVFANRYLAKAYEYKIVSITDIRHYYSITQLLVASMYVAVLSNHVGLIWLALQSSILATALLVAFYRQRSAVEAAWKYLLLCSLGTSLGLVGVVLTVYAVGQSGAENFFLLSSLRNLAVAGGTKIEIIRWAFVFLFIGFGATIGFAPMHSWVPDANSKAPSPVSVLLSGLFINVAMISLLRFRQVSDLALGDGGEWTSRFFLIFGCLSILLSALVLLIQRNYTRLLAYSNVGHMGLMAFAIGLGPAGIIPALMHMPGHALIKSALFMGAGEIFITYKTKDTTLVTDVWRRLPKTAALFLLLMLMLLAVPPSALFVSQIILLGFGLQDHLALTLLVMVAVTVAFVAITRHVHGLLVGPDNKLTSVVAEPWNSTHAVLIFQLVAAVVVGIIYLTPVGLEFMVGIAQSLNSELI